MTFDNYNVNCKSQNITMALDYKLGFRNIYKGEDGNMFCFYFEGVLF